MSGAPTLSEPRTLERVTALVSRERVIVSTSCSLLHVPYDATREDALDPVVRNRLAFAEQKLGELGLLARGLAEGRTALAKDLTAIAAMAQQPVAAGDSLGPAQAFAATAAARPPYAERRRLQRARQDLPLLPTTTIGSFPQTAEVRRTRQRLEAGRLSLEDYERFVAAEIERTIRAQEALGLDVLVHGEIERNDMVQYFGERLAGCAVTRYGWVQSYGSRCVRPPIIHGDVLRPEPMTVRWSAYAQSLTERPVKGMLTGPVTILNWSFVRDDQSRAETCRQIALALKQEVADLECAGLRVIQIDEPALREGLPLRGPEAGQLPVLGCRLLSPGRFGRRASHAGAFAHVLQRFRRHYHGNLGPRRRRDLDRELTFAGDDPGCAAGEWLRQRDRSRRL